SGVEVGAVGGRLAGPLVLTDVRFASPGLRADVERVELDWRPTALLRRTVAVVRLRAAGIDAVRLSREAPPEEPARFELPDALALPFDIEAELVAAENVRLRTSPDAEPLRSEERRVGEEGGA